MLKAIQEKKNLPLQRKAGKIKMKSLKTDKWSTSVKRPTRRSQKIHSHKPSLLIYRTRSKLVPSQNSFGSRGCCQKTNLTATQFVCEMHTQIPFRSTFLSSIQQLSKLFCHIYELRVWLSLTLLAAVKSISMYQHITMLR